MEPILRVQNLTKTFTRSGQSNLTAVNGISFDLLPGECLGIIGESGSGVSNDMILRECTYLLAFTPKALGDATVTMEYFKVDGKDLLTAPVALARTIGYKVNWTEDASYTVTGEKYAAVDGTYTFTRSEARRVGKECRSRWSPDH